MVLKGNEPNKAFNQFFISQFRYASGAFYSHFIQTLIKYFESEIIKKLLNSSLICGKYFGKVFRIWSERKTKKCQLFKEC
jgi:hypothetical protein